MRGQGGQGGRGGNGGQGGTPPTPEEQAARRAQFAEMQKQAEAILNPDQVKRLHEINIQLSKERAVLQPEVQEALGLSDGQKAKLKDLNDTYDAANQSIRQKQQNNELDRTAARDEQRKNGETLNSEIRKVLTPGQIDKLKDLGGKPFTATDTGRGGGGL